MKSIIYTCNSCGKEYLEEELDGIITLVSSRCDSHLDVFVDGLHIILLENHGELHFCNAKCIGDFFESVIEERHRMEDA